MIDRNKVLLLHPLPNVLKLIEFEVVGIDSDDHR